MGFPHAAAIPDAQAHTLTIQPHEVRFHFLHIDAVPGVDVFQVAWRRCRPELKHRILRGQAVQSRRRQRDRAMGKARQVIQGRQRHHPAHGSPGLGLGHIGVKKHQHLQGRAAPAADALQRRGLLERR